MHNNLAHSLKTGIKLNFRIFYQCYGIFTKIIHIGKKIKDCTRV